ncbi:MAG TPA: sialate O-acetylesterase [Tepidisphaeraceae bacterium]|nr:sialate O-acetylesterase [Tepidisphaeraceae bacterium]
MRPAFLISLIGLLASPLLADVRLPAIFSDHMVLQRGVKLTVWGWADPGEQVVVSIADQKVSATAADDGKWSVALNPISSAGSVGQMTVEGKNTLTISDVLVGDVWLCAGEGDMAVPLAQIHDGKQYMANTNVPDVRVFEVGQCAALRPLPDCQGHWVVSDVSAVRNFSGLAFLFGKQIHDSMKTPVGIIGAYCDHAPVKAWVGIRALSSDPQLSSLVTNDLDRADDELPDVLAINRQTFEQYQTDYDNWLQGSGNNYLSDLQRWAEQEAGQKHASTPPRERPAEPRAPVLQGVDAPTVLSNGMIWPLVPYAIKGVLWDQGESDVLNLGQYTQLTTALMSDWRNRWGEDFPFIIVQCPNMNGDFGQAAGQFPFLRQAQAEELTQPQTALVTALDAGAGKDLRGGDENTIARRAVVVARHLDSDSSIVSGPVFDKMSIDGNHVHITFKYVGSGLQTPKHRGQAEPVKGFEIAGSDKQFKPAQATIDDGGVTVWSDDVSNPVAVRYGWADNPAVNLSNREGLAVMPFRTDDW